MSNWGRGLVASVAVLTWAAGAAAQERPVALVRVYEHAAVSTPLLERSLGIVVTILSRAGVDVVWRRCGARSVEPECAAPPLPNEAIVRFVSERAALSEHGCGVAFLPDGAPAHFISLFTDCVHAEAARLRVAEGVVLGHCLAHEIGHVFMGGAHAARGLMQARPRPIDWDRAANGGLEFTAAEARRLRDGISRQQQERGQAP